MRFADQTLFGGESDVPGNCLQACIATVLDLPLEAVPHFSLFLWWPKALELWARGRSLDPTWSYIGAIPERLSIVAGPSPRGLKGGHVCVAEHGAIIHDPHPSRAGLRLVEDALWFEVWP